MTSSPTSSRFIRGLSLGVMMALLSILGLQLQPAQASTSMIKNTQSTHRSNAQPIIRLPPASALPRRRIAAGSRGACQTNQPSQGEWTMAAVVPQSAVAPTMLERPQLAFYIDSAEKMGLPMAPRQIEIVWLDEQEQEVETQVMMLGPEAGFVTLDAGSSPKLQTNQTYHWYVSLVCDEQDRALDLVLEGNMRRIDLAQWLTQQSNSTTSTTLEKIEQLSPLERAERLWQLGLWHDAVAIFDALQQDRSASPALRQAAAQQWQALLQADDSLQAIAKQSHRHVRPLGISQGPW